MGGGVSVLPVRSNIALAYCSPDHARVVLPLGCPGTILGGLRLSSSILFCLSRNPVREVLSGTLLTAMCRCCLLCVGGRWSVGTVGEGCVSSADLRLKLIASSVLRLSIGGGAMGGRRNL